MALTVTANVNDASWSPDGSRAAFVDGNGAIQTVRHNSGQNLVNVASAQGARRSHPTWSGDGRLITWAEKESTSTPWRLQTTTTTGAYLPSLASPDGTRIAFVRAGQIYTSGLTGTDIVQITSDDPAKDNPAWSHNASTIAFNTGTDGAVATAPANGSGAASPAAVAGLNGTPAYQTRVSDTVVRLAGSTRFTTPVAVSNYVWATAGATNDTRTQARSAVLARSDTFADALGGATLAAAKQGPLLLTPPDSLNADAKAEITRVLGSNTSATVYLLGSTGAISQAVQNQVAAMGYRVVRLAGSTRYSTSIAIANAIDPTPDMVLAVTGTGFPDALPAAAAAGSLDVPGTGTSAVMVLTNDSVLPTETKTYLDMVTASGNPVIFGVGLSAATATAAYGPISLVGPTRYETACLVGKVFFDGEAFAGVATGADWPDGLAGGALMATLNGPLLLTPATNTLDPGTASLLDSQSPAIRTGIIFGSAGVVDGAIDGQIGNRISGPAGYLTRANGTPLNGSTADTIDPQTPSPTTSEHRSVEDITTAAEEILSE